MSRYPASGAFNLAIASRLMYMNPQEGSIQPFVSTASEDVYRRLFHIERNCSQLLDGIDYQPDTAIAAESTKGPEIKAKSVRPLNRADRDRTCAWREPCGKIFDPHLAAVIGHDVNRNPLLLLLHPGNGDFQKFQIGD